MKAPWLKEKVTAMSVLFARAVVTYTPKGTAVAVLPSIDVDSWIGVVACAECWGSSSAQACDFGMSRAFRWRSNDGRAEHRTFAR